MDNQKDNGTITSWRSIWTYFRENSKSAAILLCLLIIYSIIFSLWHESHSIYFQFIDYVFGTIGFAFIIYEIISLKSIAQVTKSASDRTFDAISKNRQIFNVASASSLAKQITTSNRQRKFELSVDRLHELSRQLTHISTHNQNYGKSSKNLQKICINISTQLAIIEDKLGCAEDEIDSKFLNKLMIDTISALNDIEASISIEIPHL